MTSPEMNKDRIVYMLGLLAERCEAQGIRGELHLVGGAAMALAFDSGRLTGDLDGVFEPKTVLYEIAADIAAEQGLDPHWLNDGAKAFIPSKGDASKTNVYVDLPGLTVRTGSAKQLFVMKAVAGRDSDMDDLRLLYRECGFKNSDEALDLIERTYPPALLTPAVPHIVRAAAPNPIVERVAHAARAEAEKQQTGRVWVRPHRRLGRTIRGHWKNRK